MSDLIERLRHFSGDPAYGILSNARAAMVEAAARIEALEAENERLRKLIPPNRRPGFDNGEDTFPPHLDET